MMVSKYLTALASKLIALCKYLIQNNKGLNMNKKIICAILLISSSTGQLLENNSSYKNLNDAVRFAYQNKLNVLIEDFTGVG